MVAVNGTILHPITGVGATGSVTFTIPQACRTNDGYVIGNLPPIIATVTNGAFTVSLPSTDDPNVIPQGWVYTVAVATDAYVGVFQSALASTPSPTTFAAMTPVSGATPVAVYVPLTAVGVASGVASLDVTGKVPASELPPSAAGVLSVTAANGTVTVAGTTTNPTVAVGGGIPESAVAGLATDLAAKYVKPGTGIPSTDMTSTVQTSLGLAGTALQTAPVTSVNTHTGAVVLGAADVGALTQATADGRYDALGAAATEATRALAAEAASTTAIAAKASPLTTTAVQTSAYAAVANQLVPCDATAAGFAVTLPSAPADKTRLVVKKVDTGLNAVTVACAGVDVFNRAAGPTSLTLLLPGQAVTVQYVASSGIWYISADDLPLAQLDARYSQLAEAINTVATAGSIQTIPDVTVATLHDLTLTAATCTLTFPATTIGKSFSLVLRQDATGGRTVTWPTGVKWSSGAAFVPSPMPNAVDVLSFLSATAGTWFGFAAGQDMR
jgi:hypothetical protein